MNDQATHSPAPAPPADEPPEELITATQAALDTGLVGYGFSLAPAALRVLAIGAVKAARGAAQQRMLGARHG